MEAVVVLNANTLLKLTIGKLALTELTMRSVSQGAVRKKSH